MICFRFAFPMPKNGQFLELFNHALKKMVESGEMHKIKVKWATPGNYTIISHSILLLLIQTKHVPRVKGGRWALKTLCQLS